jgi:hypothetical protein
MRKINGRKGPQKGRATRCEFWQIPRRDMKFAYSGGSCSAPERNKVFLEGQK